MSNKPFKKQRYFKNENVFVNTPKNDLQTNLFVRKTCHWTIKARSCNFAQKGFYHVFRMFLVRYSEKSRNVCEIIQNISCRKKYFGNWISPESRQCVYGPMAIIGLHTGQGEHLTQNVPSSVFFKRKFGFFFKFMLWKK